MRLPTYDADEIARLLGARDATAAIHDALLAGLDPAADPPRGVVDVHGGQLLLMPSQTRSSVGVKVATVAPGNPGRGLPRIQALYLLLDAETLAPRALLDGTALTTLRTPAVSAAAVGPALGRFTDPVRLVVLGAGPQAVGHVAALSALDGHVPALVTYVVRHPERAALVPPPGSSAAEPVASAGPAVELLAASDPRVGERLRSADIVVCATSASTPVLASDDVRDGAVVVAVGSHEPSVRELDGALMGRASVVVEDVRNALREAGDVVLAIEEGHLSEERLIPMAAVVRGEVALDVSRPVVFKSTGMAWEDIVVAEAVLARATLETAG